MNDEHEHETEDKHQDRRDGLPNESRRHGLALQRLTEQARQELPPAEAPGASAAAYVRFRQERLPMGGGRGRWRLGLGFPALVAGAIALLIVSAGSWLVATSRPLSVVSSGAALEEGGFLRSPVASPSRLHFSDGTEVDVEPSGRARVAATTARGARLLLEDGRARARVVPRKGGRWFFDAGPCRVEVTGTHFDMRWSAANQLLEVLLYSGGVTVKGPPASEGVPMRAGQRLVMDVRHGTVRLSEIATTTAAPAPATVPSATDEDATLTHEGDPGANLERNVRSEAAKERPAAVSGGATRPSARDQESHLGGDAWPGRVLSGDFRAVIGQARRRGIDQVLRAESAENIMALADAARYAGSFSLAQRSLLQVRARFPQSAPAHRAAFLLGRVAEDQNGNLKKALEWYDTYLTGAPDDTFRAEAMGRQMAATLRLGGREERARTLAAQYLRRYPQGAYARAAQAMLAPGSVP